MDEEEKEAPKSKKELFLARLKEKYPDSEEDDMYDKHLGHIDEMDKASEAHNALNSKLSEHPKAAMMLADIMDGKHPAVAMKKYYSDDELNAEEGTPEYEELLNAEKERISDQESSKKAQAEYEANLEKSDSVVEEFKNEKGMSDDEVTDLFSKIMEHTANLLKGDLNKDLLEFYYQGANYNKDTQLAAEQGAIGAKNEKIEEKKVKKVGDGLPNTAPRQTQVVPKSDVKSPSFMQRKSVWED